MSFFDIISFLQTSFGHLNYIPEKQLEFLSLKCLWSSAVLKVILHFSHLKESLSKNEKETTFILMNALSWQPTGHFLFSGSFSKHSSQQL